MKEIAEAMKFAMRDEDTLATLRAENSLRAYIPLVWPVLEPNRKFVTGFAVDAICEHLQAVTDGEIQKLLINVPPGCMKSLTTCVLWPSWEWGPYNRPDLRYVCASYSDQLTIRDNRRTRLLIQSDVYQARWGSRFNLVGDQNAKTKFETNQRGFKIATSVGGLGTGERGDRLVIDDPHNVKDGESEAKRETTLAWFTETMSTRVNDPGKSAFVVIMQRVHERDVSGLIMAADMGYTHLMLPMEYEVDRKCIIDMRPKGKTFQFEDPRTEEGELLWPERFPRDYLEDDLKPALRAWGGTYAEAGQLQQRPAPRGGGMFQRDDFKILDIPPQSHRTVRAWDLAASEEVNRAYTVGVKMGIDTENRVIIYDVVRFQKTPGFVKSSIKSTAELDGYGVQVDLPQDPGQAGKSQMVDFVQHLHGFDVRYSPESGSKETRATPLSAQSEGGNLYLMRGPWNDAFINEACLFPNGQYKDQVDAASRAYGNLIQRPTQGAGGRPRLVGG